MLLEDCTDLERWYGDVWSWGPPFHASPLVHKGPIYKQHSVHKPPFREKN